MNLRPTKRSFQFLGLVLLAVVCVFTGRELATDRSGANIPQSTRVADCLDAQPWPNQVDAEPLEEVEVTYPVGTTCPGHIDPMNLASDISIEFEPQKVIFKREGTRRWAVSAKAGSYEYRFRVVVGHTIFRSRAGLLKVSDGPSALRTKTWLQDVSRSVRVSWFPSSREDIRPGKPYEGKLSLTFIVPDAPDYLQSVGRVKVCTRLKRQEVEEKCTPTKVVWSRGRQSVEVPVVSRPESAGELVLNVSSRFSATAGPAGQVEAVDSKETRIGTAEQAWLQKWSSWLEKLNDKAVLFMSLVGFGAFLAGMRRRDGQHSRR